MSSEKKDSGQDGENLDSGGIRKTLESLDLTEEQRQFLGFFLEQGEKDKKDYQNLSQWAFIPDDQAASTIQHSLVHIGSGYGGNDSSGYVSSRRPNTRL